MGVTVRVPRWTYVQLLADLGEAWTRPNPYFCIIDGFYSMLRDGRTVGRA